MFVACRGSWRNWSYQAFGLVSCSSRYPKQRSLERVYLAEVRSRRLFSFFPFFPHTLAFFRRQSRVKVRQDLFEHTRAASLLLRRSVVTLRLSNRIQFTFMTFISIDLGSDSCLWRFLVFWAEQSDSVAKLANNSLCKNRWSAEKKAVAAKFYK